MKFNGTPRQNKWAQAIIEAQNLSDGQIDNLLRYAGPTMYVQRIMDVSVVIDHRQNLGAYADSLGDFLSLSPAEKHAVAIAAADAVRAIATGRR